MPYLIVGVVILSIYYAYLRFSAQSIKDTLLVIARAFEKRRDVTASSRVFVFVNPFGGRKQVLFFYCYYFGMIYERLLLDLYVHL